MCGNPVISPSAHVRCGGQGIGEDGREACRRRWDSTVWRVVAGAKFSGHPASFMPEHCLDARITPPACDVADKALARADGGGVPLEAGFDGLARRCEGKFSGHQASFMPEHCLDARITPPARDLAIGASVRGLRIIVRIAHQNRNAAPKSHNLANIEMSCRALLNTRRHLNITQEQRNFRFKTARRALLNTHRHQNIMPENAH